MNDLRPGELARLDGFRVVFRNPAGEFRPVQIANPDDLSRVKVAFAAADSGRQEAFATFAQGFLGPGIDHERAFGAMKKGDPSLAALQLVPAWHENRPLLLSGQDIGQDILFSSRSNHQRYPGANDDLCGLNLRGHSADRSNAFSSPGKPFHSL